MKARSQAVASSRKRALSDGEEEGSSEKKMKMNENDQKS